MDTATTPLVSIDEAAAILRVNRKTLLAWDRRDYGPVRRIIGARAWYLASDLDEFVQHGDGPTE